MTTTWEYIAARLVKCEGKVTQVCTALSQICNYKCDAHLCFCVFDPAVTGGRPHLYRNLSIPSRFLFCTVQTCICVNNLPNGAPTESRTCDSLIPLCSPTPSIRVDLRAVQKNFNTVCYFVTDVDAVHVCHRLAAKITSTTPCRTCVYVCIHQRAAPRWAVRQF